MASSLATWTSRLKEMRGCLRGRESSNSIETRISNRNLGTSDTLELNPVGTWRCKERFGLTVDSTEQKSTNQCTIKSVGAFKKTFFLLGSLEGIFPKKKKKSNTTVGKPAYFAEIARFLVDNRSV